MNIFFKSFGNIKMTNRQLDIILFPPSQSLKLLDHQLWFNNNEIVSQPNNIYLLWSQNRQPYNLAAKYTNKSRQEMVQNKNTNYLPFHQNSPSSSYHSPSCKEIIDIFKETKNQGIQQGPAFYIQQNQFTVCSNDFQCQRRKCRYQCFQNRR